MDDRTLEQLYAYHDGELSGWQRLRFRSRLRGSQELRDELQFLESLGSAARELEEQADVSDAPDLWPAIQAGLRQSPAAAAGAASPAASPAAGFRVRAGFAALAAAGAAAIVVFGIGDDSPVGPVIAPPTSAGSIRYLDTGGQPVVVQDREDVTIIWLIGGEASGVGGESGEA